MQLNISANEHVQKKISNGFIFFLLVQLNISANEHVQKKFVLKILVQMNMSKIFFSNGLIFFLEILVQLNIFFLKILVQMNMSKIFFSNGLIFFSGNISTVEH